MLTINEAALQAELARLLEPHAHAGGAQLIHDLSQEGSGQFHEGNPRRSSAQGEMPAPQSEALLHSIDVRHDGGLGWTIGSFEDQDAEGFAHALDLESRPPEQGGRPFLEQEWADPNFRAAILAGQGP